MTLMVKSACRLGIISQWLGCLSYIQAMICLDLPVAVQQCTHFCISPKHAYEEVVKCICHYLLLLKTKDQELVLKPDATKGLECYFDAGWLGLGRSIHLMILSPPIQGQGILLWGMPAAPSFGGSKLQKLIALSTTEAEYIALSSALQEGG